MNRRASAPESVLAETRAYGITLVPDGARLRIGAPKGALTAALHAKIVAHKVELLALLRGDSGTVSSSYDEAVRRWRAEFTSHLGRAFGYSEEAVRVALDVLERQPRGLGFRVGRELIVIEMGEGLEVRVHRTPQPWASAEDGILAVAGSRGTQGAR
jgi:hypothetical protein